MQVSDCGGTRAFRGTSGTWCKIRFSYFNIFREGGGELFFIPWSLIWVEPKTY